MENVPDDFHPPRFHYHPLEGNQFRIVALQANAQDEPLNAKLWIKDLNDLNKDGGVPYNAVSYSWSADPTQETLLVDGWPVMVYGGIHRFLTTFRNNDLQVPPDNWTPFFIDQICINQADLKDKAHLIPLMRAIYETCHTAFIWLTPSNDSETVICGDKKFLLMAIMEFAKIYVASPLKICGTSSFLPRFRPDR